MLGYLNSVTSGLIGKWIYQRGRSLLGSLWMILYIGLLIIGYRDFDVHITRYRAC